MWKNEKKEGWKNGIKRKKANENEDWKITKKKKKRKEKEKNKKIERRMKSLRKNI